MPDLVRELVWFLPWCWAVNMGLTVFGYVVRKSAFLQRHDLPLDGGIHLKDGHRLLGDSTTIGGVFFIGAVGLVGTGIWPGHYYLLLAVLVKAGDSLGSFLKRRLGASSGSFVPGIDHGDYIIVAGGVACALSVISLPALFLAFVCTLILTPLITWSAYRIGIRRNPL